MPTGFHTVTVEGVEALCDDAVAVTLAVPESLTDRYRFQPGQSLTVRRVVAGREERRSYSICAPAGATPRIGVREVPGGLFSRWFVRQVRPGAELEVSAPSGSFTPRLDRPAHHGLIAAGSGITPVLSIVSSLLARPEHRVTLLYGNRRSDTVMFADELADLKDRYRSRLQLVHVLSREPTQVELCNGRLDGDKLSVLLDRVVPAADVDEWWLCGPYGMVTDASRVLGERGVPREQIHRELFFVDTPPDPPVRAAPSDVDQPTSDVTVLLDGRRTTTRLSRQERILDGMQRLRADLPFACKGGVCGTCRARVSSGEVHMRRNFALEEHETAAGFVLTCQSSPVSDAVTIDYDA